MTLGGNISQVFSEKHKDLNVCSKQPLNPSSNPNPVKEREALRVFYLHDAKQQLPPAVTMAISAIHPPSVKTEDIRHLIQTRDFVFYKPEHRPRCAA